jgi:hypothetical protein
MIPKSLSIALIFILVSGLLVFSGCRHSSHRHKAEWLVDYISETLDLTEPQQEDLNRMKDELLEKGRQMRAGKMAIREELLAQLPNDELDEERLKEVIFENKAQMEEMIPFFIKRLADFHRTLKPEQKTKLVAKLEDMCKWHRHGWD